MRDQIGLERELKEPPWELRRPLRELGGPAKELQGRCKDLELQRELGGLCLKLGGPQKLLRGL